MIAFRDLFTGVVYTAGDKWLAAVRESLARAVADRLRGKGDIKAAADAAARFWRDEYYERLFPLRFGQGHDERGLLEGRGLFGQGPQVELEALAGTPLRERFLDGTKLPPLLPAGLSGETSELMADRLLTQAAMVSALLSQTGTDEGLRHAARLACLIYPFLEAVEPLSGWHGVEEVARFLRGESAALPHGFDAGRIANAIQREAPRAG